MDRGGPEVERVDSRRNTRESSSFCAISLRWPVMCKTLVLGTKSGETGRAGDSQESSPRLRWPFGVPVFVKTANGRGFRPLARLLARAAIAQSGSDSVSMTLRTRIILSSTLVVVAVLAISEWLSYRHTLGFIQTHETQMLATGDHAASLMLLREQRSHLIVGLASLHVVHATVTVLALVIVLSVLWSRLFIAPLRRLREQINIMSRGTWTTAIPIARNDEIGNLTRTFNELGVGLSTTVHQFATASRLSAMALLGHQVVRRIVVSTDHLCAIETILVAAGQQGQRVPESAVHNLRAAKKTSKRFPESSKPNSRGRSRRPA